MDEKAIIVNPDKIYICTKATHRLCGTLLKFDLVQTRFAQLERYYCPKCKRVVRKWEVKNLVERLPKDQTSKGSEA